MSKKLLADPAIQALVAKERAAAVKETHKHVKAAVKAAPLHEDRTIAKHQKGVLAHVLQALKGGASED